jgi:fatty acid desaturase
MTGRRIRSGRVFPGHVVNGGLAILLIAANMFALLVLPLAPMAADPRFTWLLLPILALTSTHWALLHEAIHGLFHPHPTVNRLAGRLLSLAGGSSFRVLRFGHLMHHRFNRYRMDRPDCFDPAEISPAIARARYFFELFGGLYLIEVTVPLLFLLPRRLCLEILDRIYAHPDATVQTVRGVARQSFIGARQLRELRQDALILIALLTLAAIAWGSHWPLLLGFLLGRGFLISFLDNVYHYRTPLDMIAYAYNLRLPAPLRLAILNMNLHRVHHREPHLPWWRLPARFHERADHYDAAFGRMALDQLRGPDAIDVLASAKETTRSAA